MFSFSRRHQIIFQRLYHFYPAVSSIQVFPVDPHLCQHLVVSVLNHSGSCWRVSCCSFNICISLMAHQVENLFMLIYYSDILWWRSFPHFSPAIIYLLLKWSVEVLYVFCTWIFLKKSSPCLWIIMVSYWKHSIHQSFPFMSTYHFLFI